MVRKNSILPWKWPASVAMHDVGVLSAFSITARLAWDLIQWCGLLLRPRESLEAEILFLRRQLAMYREPESTPLKFQGFVYLLCMDRVDSLTAVNDRVHVTDRIAASVAGGCRCVADRKRSRPIERSSILSDSILRPHVPRQPP